MEPRMTDTELELIDALHSMLNLEQAATLGARDVPAAHGIDVKWHCDKARLALARARRTYGPRID